MTTLTRRYHFAASHRLHIPQWTEAANTDLYGKCNNPFGHGHNYILEVTVAGPVDETTGAVLPIRELDTLVEAAVVDQFSHRNLNSDIPEFSDRVPTTENIAAVIVERLHAAWPTAIRRPEAKLARVHVQETDRNGFEIQLEQKRSVHV